MITIPIGFTAHIFEGGSKIKNTNSTRKYKKQQCPDSRGEDDNAHLSMPLVPKQSFF